jgi:hypothetical protein
MGSCGKQNIFITNNTYTDAKKIPHGFPNNASFVVVPMQNENQLHSKELSQKIETILENKGYNLQNKDKADYYLTFNFEMNSSKKVTKVLKYIPGQEQTTKGNIYGKDGKRSGYKEKTTTPGTLAYVPKESTIFNKTLTIRVYDGNVYRKIKKEDFVWEGSANSSGQESDLRSFIDYLLMSTFRYFGKSTKKNIEIKTNTEDKDVQWLRRNIR